MSDGIFVPLADKKAFEKKPIRGPCRQTKAWGDGKRAGQLPGIDLDRKV